MSDGTWDTEPGSPTITASAAGKVAATQAETIAPRPDTTPPDCSSPTTYTSLSSAWHTVRARATDTAGNVYPTPAAYSFRI